MAWYRIYEKDDGIKQKFWVAGENTNPAVKEEEKLVGAFEYVSGRIHAYRFTTGVLKDCVKKGLELCANTPVHSIVPSTTTSSSKPVYDVFTQYTTIPTHTVILATNGYTPYLLPSLQGAIVPLRGQITVQQPPKTAKHPSVLPRTYSFIYASGYEYMIPRQLPDGGQHIVIGGGLGRLPHGGVSEYGTVDDSALNKDTSEYLQGTLSGYFGAPSSDTAVMEKPKYETVAEWTGIMGATADGRPFVGEVPSKKGVWVSAGFNGHGMVLCLKSAEALVKMIGGESGLEWFPKSFLVSEERLEKCHFRGRTDMPVPETGGGPVADVKG
jgi:glycine/D-amino acid oxidase-like deaminating enzyme